MTTVAFLLILFSALMHALWNLLVKRSGDKTVFIWWMFISSGGLFTLSLPWLPEPFPPPTPQVLLYAVVGGACFVLYHLLTGRAYSGGDLSLAYPLAQTSMLYVPLWGVWILGESISLTGLCGILCIVAGTYTVQLRRFSLDELTRPLRNLGTPSVQAALAAGFIYSIGAVTDKSGVSIYPPLHFTYLLVVAMLFFFSLNLLRPKYRGRVLREGRERLGLVLLSGPVMMGSFLTFRYALKLSPLSYAVPVRQVSILFGVLLGILLLGEPCGRTRSTAALLIIAGVALIRLG